MNGISISISHDGINIINSDSSRKSGRSIDSASYGKGT